MKSEAHNPICLKQRANKKGYFESERMGRHMITVTKTPQETVIDWFNFEEFRLALDEKNRLKLKEEEAPIEEVMRFPLGQAPYPNVRYLVKSQLAQLPLEEALTHPVRSGIILQDGASEENILEPISFQEVVDDIANAARLHAEQGIFNFLAENRAVPGWEAKRGVWVEPTREEFLFVASISGIPEVDIQECDRVIIKLDGPYCEVLVMVLRGEVDFDEKRGWTGIEKFICVNTNKGSDEGDYLLNLAPKLLPDGSKAFYNEPFRVASELVELIENV